ncbi:MAG: transposase [Deltaproteobacteria bacterium]|nr:transposase [Deltaproteobacteria bacterium]
MWCIDFKGWFRTADGMPFASVGAGGLSRLSVWWVKLGIMPERIAPGQPQQNGRHQRMHRTLKAECSSPPAAQQQRFDEFRIEFNQQRPHEALGQTPPAQHYAPAVRSYPARL